MAPAVFLCSGKLAVQSSHCWQILGCAFPLLCPLSAFQSRNPRASLKSMRWEITSLPPFPFGPGVQWGSASRLDRAVAWMKRCFPVPLSWHTPGPAPAHTEPSPPCCCPGWNQTRCRQQQNIEPAWFRAQCAAHVCHTCTWGGLWEKGQKQAPLGLAELHLAFDFLTGSDFG